MPDLAALQSRFNAPGITFSEEASGLVYLSLSTGSAAAKKVRPISAAK